MATPATGKDTRLPIKSVITAFFIILGIVAFIAAIAGENQKMKITARKFLNEVADRSYKDAFDSMTEEAKKATKPDEFRSTLIALRTYFRVQYGISYDEEYSYYFKAPFWLPWRGDNVKTVSVGVYKKGKGSAAELMELIKTPPVKGPVLDGLITVERQKGIWKVTAVKFNLADFPDVQKKAQETTTSFFTPNEYGFDFEGFVYDRRTATQDQRLRMLDALKQATQEIENDMGKKKNDLDGILKMLP